MREVDLILSGVLLGQERAIRQRRGEIYSLGQLLMIATHAPKTFPKPAAFLDGRRQHGSSDAELSAYFAGRVAQRHAAASSKGA
ncbi:hypothetical protein [Pseudooceanicola spongiae]|uniref:Uncharacterized protein n=1 Tax=Pseudooceanicola spongiae TaxID=2613965 RepID=A0A7L9WLY5_9RHOB|nr:hypothetical protein [Pseudooceanicola spongiae]QOL80538.1 hypothetical protein F3W81_06770 [Pseudooceanicola spongiae]